MTTQGPKRHDDELSRLRVMGKSCGCRLEASCKRDFLNMFVSHTFIALALLMKYLIPRVT